MIDRDKLDKQMKVITEMWGETWEPRKVERLDDFYSQLKAIHKNWPDWRFGQFICNFFGWLHSKYKMDPFFPEEEQMLIYLHEFVTDMKPKHKDETSGGDV